jgi:hypothetical protein
VRSWPYLIEPVTWPPTWPQNVRVETMRIVRLAAATALLGATAIGLAGPAGAEELTSGLYGIVRSGVHAPGNTASVWTVKRCGTDCAQIVSDNGVTWDARLESGRWVASLHQATAVDCRNGYSAPGTSVFSLDAQTLRGTIVSTSDGPACGSPVPITSGPVTVFMDKA